jgi:hypothetical protein
MQRSPQLGVGLKVKPLSIGDLEKAGIPKGNLEEEFVILDSEKKTNLVEFIKSIDRMPKSAKERLIKQIDTGQLTSKTLKRLERRMKETK